MLKAECWNNNVPRVELDQRARDARLRLEQLKRRLVPRGTATASWLRRALCLYTRSEGKGGQTRRTRGPLSNRRPDRMPEIRQGWSPAA